MSNYPIVKVYIVWDTENNCLWKTPSKKYIWHKKNHARSAITLHEQLKYPGFYGLYNDELKAKYKKWKEDAEIHLKNVHSKLKVIECTCTEFREV